MLEAHHRISIGTETDESNECDKINEGVEAMKVKKVIIDVA